jgi:hypothetical protein
MTDSDKPMAASGEMYASMKPSGKCDNPNCSHPKHAVELCAFPADVSKEGRDNMLRVCKRCSDNNRLYNTFSSDPSARAAATKGLNRTCDEIYCFAPYTKGTTKFENQKKICCVCSKKRRNQQGTTRTNAIKPARYPTGGEVSLGTLAVIQEDDKNIPEKHTGKRLMPEENDKDIPEKHTGKRLIPEENDEVQDESAPAAKNPRPYKERVQVEETAKIQALVAEKRGIGKAVYVDGTRILVWGKCMNPYGCPIEKRDGNNNPVPQVLNCFPKNGINEEFPQPDPSDMCCFKCCRNAQDFRTLKLDRAYLNKLYENMDKTCAAPRCRTQYADRGLQPGKNGTSCNTCARAAEKNKKDDPRKMALLQPYRIYGPTKVEVAASNAEIKRKWEKKGIAEENFNQSIAEENFNQSIAEENFNQSIAEENSNQSIAEESITQEKVGDTGIAPISISQQLSDSNAADVVPQDQGKDTADTEDLHATVLRTKEAVEALLSLAMARYH